MKTYLGNYLGLVVDDRDPQQRGRVKIFIPHVMPALYEDWNKEGEDITFNITDSSLPSGLNPKIIERLQKILPWAECAAPVFGAGPAGRFNYADSTINQEVGNRAFGNFDDLQKQGAGSGEVLPGGAIAPSSINGLPSNVTLEAGKQLPSSDLISLLSQAATNVYGNGASVEIFSGHREYTGTTTRHSGNWAADVVFRDSSGNSITGDNLAPVVKYWHDNNLGSTGLNGGNEYSKNPAMARDGAIHMDLVGGRYGRPLEGGEALYWVYRGSLSSAMQNAISNIASSKLSYVQTTAQPPAINPSGDHPPTPDVNMVQPDEQTGTVQDSGKLPPDWTRDEQGAPVNPQGIVEPLGPDDTGATSNTSNMSSAFKAQYDRVYNALEGSPLIGTKPLDKDRYGITNGSRSEWAHFFTRMAAVESAFKPNAQSGPSYGLYQMGLPQFNLYSGGRGTWDNPDDNTRAFVKYAEGLYFGDSNYGVLGGVNRIAYEQNGKYYGISAGYGPLQRSINGNFLSDNERQVLGENISLSETQTGNYTEAVAETAAAPVVQHTTPIASVGGENTNYMPTGMFGGARAGQTVWAFFQEGNPLFPVYFAASYGEKEWANMFQHSSLGLNDPRDSFQNSEHKISLGSGGMSSKEIFSGQSSGFEKDEFVFEVFGKNGSALTFTFLATILYSKYDFRQHTQGDAHYITGGNREDRTTGDHNFVCEQDLIFTVGNWTQEALDAASEIQKVIDEAMKAAKDTYEA